MPVTLARLQAQFDEELHGKSEHNRVSFAIEADNKCIGGITLFNFDQIARTCELGVGIGDRAYWGRGYGRDAIRTLLDYAFRLRNIHKVYLAIYSNNERAIRCYRACGFVEEGRQRKQAWVNGEYVDVILMGLLREEWKAL